MTSSQCIVLRLRNALESCLLSFLVNHCSFTSFPPLGVTRKKMRYGGNLPTQLVSITLVQPCEEKRRGERERGEGAKSLGSRVSAGGFNLCVL